ncbi:MAG: hypothetical protein ACTSRI_20445 [Promethearchaeota archaeon]
MSLRKEKDYYPIIKKWLKELLISNYPKKKVYTFDTSQIYLNKFIQDKNWTSYRSDYPTYQIKIDILGVLIEKDNLDFIFIEVKNIKISLKDVSQLLGYSRVAKPLHSLIISPKWISNPVKILFDTYRRFDVLKYNENKYIKICKWDDNKKDIDYNYIYPGKPLLNFSH